MKHFSLCSLMVAAFMSVTFGASAIVAKQGVHTITQSDGTQLRVILSGDETRHTYTTEDGYLLLENNDTFYYATLDRATGRVESTKRVARNPEARSAADASILAGIDRQAVKTAFLQDMTSTRPMRSPRANAQGPGLFPGTAFPSMGEQKVLVVLVQYTNVSFTLDDPAAYFTRMLNEQNFADYGATGSARDFFIDGSMGQFLPEMDVYGPITLSHNQSYYGGNDWMGNDQNPEQMAIEACQQLDATVDFSQYDRDGDGYIDNVYIFYAGKGEADGGGASTVWPHSWEVSAATSTPYYFDGVRLDRYACSNEWDNYGNRPDGIGTFCHEFSHVMGLPDLYATSYTSAYTPGAYSVMDYGPYNNDGMTPPSYSAFERYALGWIDPIEITGACNGIMGHIMDTNRAYLINTPKANEYFLFENRQQKGWDTYIPGHGMLVWHIDYNDAVWNTNTVNNSAGHQYVDLEEADNKQNSSNADGDPFPGTANKTEFTDDTAPSMRTWNGTRLNLPITDIAETDGMITFKVCGGVAEVEAPVIAYADDATAISFSISWDAVENADNYRVTLEEVSASGTKPVDAYTGLSIGNVTSFTFDYLTPETTYQAWVVAENTGYPSPKSNVVTVTTAAPTFADYVVKLCEPTDITPTSFNLNWEVRDDATDYLITVFSREVAGSEETTLDFTSGLNKLPEGWTTNSNVTYNNSDYAGAAVPALKLGADGIFLQSPVYENDVYSLSFWMRGANCDAANTVSLMGLRNGEWEELALYSPSNNRGGETIEIPYIPEGIRAVKLVYNKVASGNVAIDDVKVTVVTGINVLPAGEYTDYRVGTSGSFTVTGLTPETRYFYTVRGDNGEMLSRKSEEGFVTTEVAVGCSAAVAENIAIRVNGLTANVTAPAGTRIVVSDLSGRTVAQAVSAGIAQSLRLPAAGVYLVRAGGSVAKVIVK